MKKLVSLICVLALLVIPVLAISQTCPIPDPSEPFLKAKDMCMKVKPDANGVQEVVKKRIIENEHFTYTLGYIKDKDIIGASVAKEEITVVVVWNGQAQKYVGAIFVNGELALRQELPEEQATKIMTEVLEAIYQCGINT